MGKNHSKFAPKNLPIQNITVNNIYNNCQINYNALQNNYNQYNNFGTKKPNSDCYCPICGEEFLKGKFVNSGKKKDYFDCRKCKVHQIDKYYFKCKNCESKFCTECPKANNYLPNYSCPLCGEQFLQGKGKFVNSGEKKDYFDCRKCNVHQIDKYYFKCKNCQSKFCTECPKVNNYLPNYSCPLCGEQFLQGKGKFVNSGEKKDYFDCRKCKTRQIDKYYFKCKNCQSKFCTECSMGYN